MSFLTYLINRNLRKRRGRDLIILRMLENTYLFLLPNEHKTTIIIILTIQVYTVICKTILKNLTSFELKPTWIFSTLFLSLFYY